MITAITENLPGQYFAECVAPVAVVYFIHFAGFKIRSALIA
jgi:hypothetical protein